MSSEPDPAHLLGAMGDPRLLEPTAQLPVAVGRPEPLPAVPARSVIVGVGATMTGLTLLGGLAVAVLGVVLAFSHGVDVLDGVLMAVGVFLVATHWGWVHVAEAAGGAAAARVARDAAARREQWLDALAPFVHHEVVTEVEDDGAIAIIAVRFAPVATAPGRFAFVREIESRERHGPQEPAAVVSERAETLRREAALATDRERRAFLAAADRQETAALRDQDEHDAREVERAAARALSEQINANLRQPPLDG